MIGPKTLQNEGRKAGKGRKAGRQERRKDTHPSENGAERLQEHRILLSCIHSQLLCQAAQQRVVVGGTDSLHFGHAGQGDLTPQLLALSVQLPKLAIIQTPEVEQVPDLGLTVRYSWLQTQELL